MDSLTTQKIKPRKMKMVAKKSRFQILLDLFFRVLEISVVMITLAKLCYQLVITFDSYVFAGFLINRHLAFIAGNAIVITLVVTKFNIFGNRTHGTQTNQTDIYEEFVRNSSRRVQNLEVKAICDEAEEEIKHNLLENSVKQSREVTRQNRVKQGFTENKVKQSLTENRAKQSVTENRVKQSNEEREKKGLVSKKKQQNICEIEEIQEIPQKIYESENPEMSKKRSETEKSTERIDSDDELRYKIESFIARQRRNQKDEEFCII